MIRKTLAKALILGMATAGLACAKQEPACTYSAQASDIKLEWTGYKTNQKVAATGTFPNSKLGGPTSAGTLAELMKGLTLTIDAGTVSTGNPGRDATIQEFFFGKLNPPFQLSAAVDRVEGDDKQGSLWIKTTMNGQSQALPFSYTGDPALGTVTATGSLDILQQFGAQPAFDSLHQACESQHTGTDGVSKTWTTVDLKLSAKYQKNCR